MGRELTRVSVSNILLPSPAGTHLMVRTEGHSTMPTGTKSPSEPAPHPAKVIKEAVFREEPDVFMQIGNFFQFIPTNDVTSAKSTSTGTACSSRASSLSPSRVDGADSVTEEE